MGRGLNQCNLVTLGSVSLGITIRFFLCALLSIVLFSFSVQCLAKSSFTIKHAQHPRLYLDQARVDFIRNVLTTRKKESSVLTRAWDDTEKAAVSLAAALNQGDKPIAAVSAPPRKLIDAAKLLGLGYLITGREEYLAAAGVYIQQLVGVSPPDSGGDYSQAGRVEAMGILYDWFFDALSIDQKSSLADAIKSSLPSLADYICGKKNTLTKEWSCSIMPPYPDALGGHSHQNNKEISAGLLAIIDEYPELLPLLTLEYENFSGVYNSAREWIAADGGFQMGWSYAGTYLSLDSIQLWGSATINTNLVREWQGKVIDFYIYGLRGDMRFPSRGDGKAAGLKSPELVTFALSSAQNFDHPQAMQFYKDWIEPAQKHHRFNELLYWNPDTRQFPIEKVPLSKHFRNSGMVLMRDTWDYLNATLLEFKSTPFWTRNHHHLDQNSFTLFYKAPLLIDSGYYDNYKSAHWSNYYTRSIAHNVITIWDPEERFARSKGQAFSCCSNDGGQRFMPLASPTLEQIQPGGINALDGVVAYEHNDLYTYVRGNASKAYSPNKLDQSTGFIRDVVFLPKVEFWDKPLAVIFDKVTASKEKSNLKKRFLLHAATEPVNIDGKREGPGIHQMKNPTFVIQNGGGVVYSQTVLPTDAVLTKIGGQDSDRDYRFLVPNFDTELGYTLEGDSVEHKFITAPVGMPEEGIKSDSWRIEVSAPDSVQVEYFLHVFSVADEATQGPPLAKNESTSAFAIINVAQRYLLAFNKLDTSPEKFEISWTGGRPDILIAGLEPSTSYEVVYRNIVDSTRTTMYFEQKADGGTKSSESGLLAMAAEKD